MALALGLLFGLHVTHAETPPLPSGTVSRIAFGSCAKHWQAQPIWDAVLAGEPDLWLFLGDAIYADTDGVTAWDVTEKQLQGEWNRLADKPEFQRFRKQVPMMATWDNHDYGSHDGGAEFAGKEFSKRIFLDFFREPEESERRSHRGIYDARVFGPEGRRVQIILLDTRTFRGPFSKDPRPKEERRAAGKVGGYLPNTDPSTTVLGVYQWTWLAEQLQRPADVRLVCSSTQVIPDQKGMDEWGCFPHERHRLLDLARAAGNVLLLSGNVHFAEVSQTPDGALTEFTSSGMTHVNEVYAKAENAYRVQGPFADLNFGLVEIAWEPILTLSLRAIGLDGTARFAYMLEFEKWRGTQSE